MACRPPPARHTFMPRFSNHKAVDYRFVLEHCRALVDTRNATRGVSLGREKIRKL